MKSEIITWLFHGIMWKIRTWLSLCDVTHGSDTPPISAFLMPYIADKNSSDLPQSACWRIFLLKYFHSAVCRRRRLSSGLCWCSPWRTASTCWSLRPSDVWKIPPPCPATSRGSNRSSAPSWWVDSRPDPPRRLFFFSYQTQQHQCDRTPCCPLPASPEHPPLQPVSTLPPRLSVIAGERHPALHPGQAPHPGFQDEPRGPGAVHPVSSSLCQDCAEIRVGGDRRYWCKTLGRASESGPHLHTKPWRFLMLSKFKEHNWKQQPLGLWSSISGPYSEHFTFFLLLPESQFKLQWPKLPDCPDRHWCYVTSLTVVSVLDLVL